MKRTPEQRAAHSQRMTEIWARRKAKQTVKRHRARQVPVSSNGALVEAQIILHVKSHDISLTQQEATSLHTELSAVLARTSPTA